MDTQGPITVKQKKESKLSATEVAQSALETGKLLSHTL